MIAHGDVEISWNDAKTKYHELHEIIRRVLVRFFVEYSNFPHTSNYFSDLPGYIENRRKKLSIA